MRFSIFLFVELLFSKIEKKTAFMMREFVKMKIGNIAFYIIFMGKCVISPIYIKKYATRLFPTYEFQ